MAKALETNDNTAQNQKRQPQQSADEPRPEKLEGKSFQVNENSVEEGGPIHSSAPPPPQPSEEKPDGQKIQGKAFQVNENSLRSSVNLSNTPKASRPNAGRLR